ncbi:MAG TPA: hypothetical protein VIT23_18015, partial [Terrimicrobiaceae bacterium]
LLPRTTASHRPSSALVWRAKGCKPVGLVLASGYVMSKAADQDWRAYLLTGICTILSFLPK